MAQLLLLLLSRSSQVFSMFIHSRLIATAETKKNAIVPTDSCVIVCHLRTLILFAQTRRRFLPLSQSQLKTCSLSSYIRRIST